MFRGKDNALMPNWKHLPVSNSQSHDVDNVFARCWPEYYLSITLLQKLFRLFSVLSHQCHDHLRLVITVVPPLLLSLAHQSADQMVKQGACLCFKFFGLGYILMGKASWHWATQVWSLPPDGLRARDGLLRRWRVPSHGRDHHCQGGGQAHLWNGSHERLVREGHPEVGIHSSGTFWSQEPWHLYFPLGGHHGGTQGNAAFAYFLHFFLHHNLFFFSLLRCPTMSKTLHRSHTCNMPTHSRSTSSWTSRSTPRTGKEAPCQSRTSDTCNFHKTRSDNEFLIEPPPRYWTMKQQLAHHTVRERVESSFLSTFENRWLAATWGPETFSPLELSLDRWHNLFFTCPLQFFFSDFIRLKTFPRSRGPLARCWSCPGGERKLFLWDRAAMRGSSCRMETRWGSSNWFKSCNWMLMLAIVS